MFQKKQSVLQVFASSSVSNPYAVDVFKQKTFNHDFFLLVRDKKYEQAYSLGMRILKKDPNNPSVLNFCSFIEQNLPDLKQMVLEQQEYETDSQAEQEQQCSDQEENDKKSVLSTSSLSGSKTSLSSLSSNSSVLSKASQVSKGSKTSKASTQSKKSINGKQNGPINKVNKWQHNCKNQKCPNKKA